MTLSEHKRYRPRDKFTAMYSKKIPIRNEILVDATIRSIDRDFDRMDRDKKWSMIKMIQRTAKIALKDADNEKKYGVRQRKSFFSVATKYNKLKMELVRRYEKQYGDIPLDF